MMARSTLDATQPFITLNTSNGGITLGGAAGTISIVMSAAQTQALTIFGGTYNLELTDASDTVSRLLQGNLTVNRDVTR